MPLKLTKKTIENKRFMNYNSDMSTELFHKKFSIIQEISNAIVITDNISSVANLMLDLATNYCSAEKGSLMLKNDRNELYILAAIGMDLHFISTYRLKIGEGIAGSVAENLSPVHVRDIETDERFQGKTRDRYKTKSFISCPVISRNKLIGVININDKLDGDDFSDDEFELLKIIANHAAIALENSFLMTQLKAKAVELEDINKKLLETDVVKTEFLAKISHELRTPLNSVKGAIYYLKESGAASKIEQDEFYDIISTETDKLVNIMDNLIEYLRTEDETKILKKTVINVAGTIKGILESKSLKTMFVRKNVRLHFEHSERVSDIVGDSILVAQLFLNLLEGLIHYLNKGDKINISLTEDDYVRVNISCSQLIPNEILPYLYEEKAIFKDDHPEDRLKLYLAKNIVDLHRWKLQANNIEDSFQLTIDIPKSTRQMNEAYINTSMDLFVDFVSEVLDLDICSIMLSDELTNELVIKGARGLDDNIIRKTRIKMGEKIAGWVALEGKPLFIENIETDTRFGRKSISQYATKSLLSIPVRVHDRTVGVLNLNNKRNASSFTERDFYVATVLSERIAGFINRVYSGELNETEFKKFIASFEGLLNAERRYHKKIDLLSDVVIHVMDELGASEDDKKLAIYISMIYDIGLTLVNEEIMRKGKLSSSEKRSVKIHPYNAVNLLEGFEISDNVKKVILHHHERYDGTGYPDGLKGENIPFMSRVLSVVDSFFAMVGDKSYGKKYSKEHALSELKDNAGSGYDPRIVNAFCTVLNKIDFGLS
jgi:hypothetical protein